MVWCTRIDSRPISQWVRVLLGWSEVCRLNDYRTRRLFSRDNQRERERETFTWESLSTRIFTSILDARYLSLVSQHKLNGALVGRDNATGGEAKHTTDRWEEIQNFFAQWTMNVPEKRESRWTDHEDRRFWLFDWCVELYMPRRYDRSAWTRPENDIAHWLRSQRWASRFVDCAWACRHACIRRDSMMMCSIHWSFERTAKKNDGEPNPRSSSNNRNETYRIPREAERRRRRRRKGRIFVDNVQENNKRNTRLGIFGFHAKATHDRPSLESITERKKECAMCEPSWNARRSKADLFVLDSMDLNDLWHWKKRRRRHRTWMTTREDDFTFRRESFRWVDQWRTRTESLVKATKHNTRRAQ